MINNYQDFNKRKRIRKILVEQITPFELKDVIEAILLLNNSLKVTIGEDWLSKSSGVEIPFDIVNILWGKYEPDERGVLQLKDK